MVSATRQYEGIIDGLEDHEARLIDLESTKVSGAWYDDIEKRLSKLEETINSLKIPQWNYKQWSVVEELKGEAIYLRSKVMETRVQVKQKTGRYNKYIAEETLNET